MLGRHRSLEVLGVPAGVDSRYGFLVGVGRLGWRVATAASMRVCWWAALARSSGGSVIRGRQIAPKGCLGVQPERGAGVGAGQEGLQLVVLGAQPRADRWLVEDGDVGGDQRDDVAWARKTAR
jgi:hypothetical protein